MQTGATTFDVRRYELVFAHPQRELAVTIAVDERGGLVSVNLPAQALDVVRDDVSSPTRGRSSIRTPATSRSSFRPPASTSARRSRGRRPRPARACPAVILLAGSGASDRDGAGPRRADDWPACGRARRRRLHDRALRQARIRAERRPRRVGDARRLRRRCARGVQVAAQPARRRSESHRRARPRRRRVGRAPGRVARAAVRRRRCRSRRRPPPAQSWSSSSSATCSTRPTRRIATRRSSCSRRSTPPS